MPAEGRLFRKNLRIAGSSSTRIAQDGAAPSWDSWLLGFEPGRSKGITPRTQSENPETAPSEHPVTPKFTSLFNHIHKKPVAPARQLLRPNSDP
jgi:hypothetical protein